MSKSKILTKGIYLTKKIFTFLKKNRTLLISLIFFAVLSDSLLFKQASDIRFFSALVLYIFSIWLYRLKSKLTFALCLVLLIIMYIQFLLGGPSPETEKTAVWLVLFLLVGIVQQWRE